MKIAGRNTSKRKRIHILWVEQCLMGNFSQKKLKEQKYFFHMTTCGLLIRRAVRTIFALVLCSKVEVAVASRWMNTFQWNHSTTMANHSCPRHSDVWRFCNIDFIFVMSTCQFFIRPGRGQGAGPIAIPVSSLRRASPRRPVAKQHGGMPSPGPCAEPPSVQASKTNRRLPIDTGSRYIALPKRICSLRIELHRFAVTEAWSRVPGGSRRAH